MLQLSLAWGDASVYPFPALLSTVPAVALWHVHILGTCNDPPHLSVHAADSWSHPHLLVQVLFKGRVHPFLSSYHHHPLCFFGLAGLSFPFPVCLRGPPFFIGLLIIPFRFFSWRGSRCAGDGSPLSKGSSQWEYLRPTLGNLGGGGPSVSPLNGSGSSLSKGGSQRGYLRPRQIPC
jgi:hypothetical protein